MVAVRGSGDFDIKNLAGEARGFRAKHSVRDGLDGGGKSLVTDSFRFFKGKGPASERVFAEAAYPKRILRGKAVLVLWTRTAKG